MKYSHSDFTGNPATVARKKMRMKWTRYNQKYPKRWALKSHISAHLRPMAKRVEFPFETVWIVRDENRRVMMEDGAWAETFDFYLKTPGHVIGFADMASADGSAWAEEWRNAMIDRRLGK